MSYIIKQCSLLFSYFTQNSYLTLIIIILGSNERDYDLQSDDINGSSGENEENIAKYEI